MANQIQQHPHAISALRHNAQPSVKPPVKPTLQAARLVIQRAAANPASLTSMDVTVLQRTIGNRSTTRLLRPLLQRQGLTLGPANDEYEEEADRVAEQVSRQIDYTPAPATEDPQIQRDDLDDEVRLQAKPLIEDSTERPPLSSLSRALMVQKNEEEAPLHGPEGGIVAQSVQQQIQAARSGGTPMADCIRGQMEQGFGADFSTVRIHTNGQASTLNRSLNARAFTAGRDIFFQRGQYQPNARDGQKLLAHELMHTVQQGAVDVQRSPHHSDGRHQPASRGFVKPTGVLAPPSPRLSPVGLQQTNALTEDAVLQRKLMSGQQLLQRTDPTSVPIQQIAVLVNQYRNTKGLFVKVTPQIANQRFGLLRQIDTAVYGWFNTVSQNNEHLDENPHTPVMKRLLTETDKEHIDLVNKTKNNQQVTPFDTGGMNPLEIANAQALWQSIAGGQGKIKMVGGRAHNKKMLSDLAKIMSSAVGRNLLSYLNSQTPAEGLAGGVQDPLTNIFIGQNVNQLPGTVTGQLPQQLQETGVSQSQPLIDNQAMLQGGVPIPIGGPPGNFRAAGHRRDFRQAVRTNQRGVTHGGQQYAFGQGTGAFVRVVDHGDGLGEATGVAGVDHEVLMPRFVTLAHELGHSANQRAGAGTAGGMNYDALFALAGGTLEEAKNRWDDPEEFLNILNIENAVRGDTGLEARTSHRPVDAVKKTRRWLDIKNQVVAQFGLNNHPDSFSAMNALSQGVWFTDSGEQFATELVRVRNEIHDDTKWNPLQPLLNQFLHMNVANEKGQFFDDNYNEAMNLVGNRGGRAGLNPNQQNLYDTVHTAYTTQRNATLASPAEYLRIIDRLLSLKGALGAQIRIPGNGMPLLRWAQ